MKFYHYQSMPMKARISTLQKRLIDLGYDKVTVTGKQDKQTTKALTDFQKINGITPNGIVCEKTFIALKI